MTTQLNPNRWLVFLLFLTLGGVGGVAGAAMVEPWREGGALESRQPVRQEVAMFDPSLVRPIPDEEAIPLDEGGQPDWDVSKYVFAQNGAREITPYHRYFGGLNRVSLGVFLQVLQNHASYVGLRMPRNPLDLVHYYPELRVTELNRRSEHLLRTPDHRVLNLAAHANLVEQGIDPSQALDEWIHPLPAYSSHYLTHVTGAVYLPKAKRPAWNPIRTFIDNNVDDPETAKVLHFAFASPLVGWQTFKAVHFLIGLKNASKSTTLNTIDAVYGSYSMTVPPILLLPYNEDRLVKELFANQGKRILRIDELNAETFFNEPLIKRITGRDGLANPFVTHPLRDFTPQVKIFCDSNAPLKPQIGDESSIADRLFYYPYGKVVPVASRDPHFERDLQSPDKLDLYFSWLIDTFAMDVIKGRLS